MSKEAPADAKLKEIVAQHVATWRLLLQFEQQLLLVNQNYIHRGIRNIVPKQVHKNGPKGSTCYTTFDGEQWTSECMRMNARQLRDQKKHILSGCIRGCDL